MVSVKVSCMSADEMVGLFSFLGDNMTFLFLFASKTKQNVI